MPNNIGKYVSSYTHMSNIEFSVDFESWKWNTIRTLLLKFLSTKKMIETCVLHHLHGTYTDP